MSFVIATIHKQTDVYIASDSQLTNMSILEKFHNVSKIEFINPSVAIGISGTYQFCKLVTDVLKIRIERSSRPIVNAFDIENEIMADIYNAERIWSEAHPDVVIDSTLLIAGYNGVAPYISAITVVNHKVDLIHDMAPALQYEFIPAPPSDVDIYSCIETCTTHLKWATLQQDDSEKTLESLVGVFANRSEYVDENAKVFKVSPRE